MKQKISFIATIFNETDTIENFLESIFNQTKQPDEIIIVDAGSIDGTIEKTKQIIKNYPDKKIKLIIKKGVNRSQGRNIAIEKAKYEIIAVSDAGCRLDKNWLFFLSQPFKNPSCSVAAGNYAPLAKTSFQKCLAAFTCADLNKKTGFLPSSRSIAFKKTAWHKVNGYPKNLNYAEDLVFDQKLKKAGFNFCFAPKAVVFWPQRKTPQEAFRQFFHYAYGDGRVFFSPYQYHSRQITLLFLRYLLGLILLLMGLTNPVYFGVLVFLLTAYLIYAILKTIPRLNKKSALIYAPFIQILSDLAVISGALKGIIEIDNKASFLS